MDEESVVYTYSGILFSHKKEILSYYTTCMDLKDILLSEKKLVTEEQILHDFTYTKYLKESNL